MAESYKVVKGDLQHELLVNIATMYYNDDLSQLQISEKLGISRSNVSKLLKTARNLGIVDIRISDVAPRSFSIGEQIRERFNLKEVVISPSNIDYDVNLSNIGLSAAKYLEDNIKDNTKIGISWGSSIYSMIYSVSPVAKTNVEVVQLMGGMNWRNSYKFGIQLVMALSERIGGSARFMNAPLILRSKEVKESLMEEAYIKRHMKLVQDLDMAFIGIGNNNPEHSTMLDNESITKKELKTLWSAGVKAHICGKHITMNGEEADVDMNKRTLSINLNDLRKIPNVIGIAGGPDKVEPIIACLNGNYLNTLITDEKTAILLESKTRK